MKVLILLILPCLINAQTVVIAKKTKNSIIVSADSRSTFYLTGIDPSGKTRAYDSICKIYCVGKFNFAVMGGMIMDNIKAAKKACANGEKFEEVISSFANNLRDTLTYNLEMLRKYVPKLYTDIVESLRPNFCQTIFFGYQDDTAFLKVVLFKVNNTISQQVDITGYLGQKDLLYGGHVSEIKDTIEIKSTWKAGIVQTMKRLIKIEEKYHSDEVGGAIQIIKVKKKRTKWLSKKPPCV